MDGTLAIENNLNALKRILAGLVAMAGLGSAPLAAEDARQGKSEPPAEPGEGSVYTLPRHLRLAILRLLRPAESAARRLIIAAARGLTVTLPPARPRKAMPVSPEPLLRRFGIAVTLSPANTGVFTSPLCGLRGQSSDRASGSIVAREGRGDWEAIGDPGKNRREASGGGCDAPLTVAFPLLDPLKRPFRADRRTVPPHAAPRILLPGIAAPHRLPPPPSRDDPIDATRLSLRLAALAAALDDIEGQAERFARRQARAARSAHGRPARRIWPLRPGRPPGGRLTRYDPSATHMRRVREVDEILAHAHALALHALERPDTS